MTFSSYETKRVLIGGTFRLFLAECLAVPTGLLITLYLARKLGAHGFGLFTLTAVLISWIEFSIAALFTRATIKFVGQTNNWKLVGTTVTRLYLLISLAVTGFLWFLAPLISHWLKEPVLTDYLRLFAIDIPLFGLSRAYQNILVGMGRYNDRAVLSAVRWITRLLLIFAFVQAGFSIRGAIFGAMGATIAEFATGYFLLRPPFLFGPGMSERLFWNYSGLLFLSVLSLTLYKQLDLFMLKALGGSAELAGIYGVSQRLSILSEIFTGSLSSLLILSLSRFLSQGNILEARKMGHHAIRVLFCLLPFAGMGAGMSPEIIQWIFGSDYMPSAPLLATLLFGVLAWNVISIATAILAAFDKPRWAFYLTGPLVPLAIAGHLFIIPKFGILGAAWVTTLLAFSGMFFSLVILFRLLKIDFPIATLTRGLVICLGVYVSAKVWPVSGYFLLFKLAIMSVFILCAFLISRELSPKETAQMRAWFSKKNLSKKFERNLE